MKKILNFSKKQKDEGIKILTLKQILQRLPIALAQVKVGNTSENLLNEIKQIIKREKDKILCTAIKSVQQYNEFDQVMKKEWILYL